MISGHATAEGTARYRKRFPTFDQAGHFRRAEHVPGTGELWLSSLGLGTYLGEPDEAADHKYTDAIVTALRSGINLLDTAINYRHQRSERNIGTVLQQVIGTSELQRDEVMVCTKAGYLTFDANMPTDPRGYFVKEYVEPGILDPKDIAGGMHCMAPRYLSDQIGRSQRNLGMETIDVFYLHNPETQLADISREEFRRRLTDAFTMLEDKAGAGALRYYGVATWNGFRASPDAQEHLNLFEIVQVAEEVAGLEHHFRFVQLPFNLAMHEAYSSENQNSGTEKLTLLGAAQKLGIAVVGSATLLQGRLNNGLPREVLQKLGASSDREAAIQFSRSAPGIAASLIGMGQKEHVTANLDVTRARLPQAMWESLFAGD
jgi:aryl-alcohol dehydrogenase-like predicted oxidoreductase